VFILACISEIVLKAKIDELSHSEKTSMSFVRIESINFFDELGSKYPNEFRRQIENNFDCKGFLSSSGLEINRDKNVSLLH